MTPSAPQVLLTETAPSRSQNSRNTRERDSRNNMKTEVCRNSSRGFCRWGAECRFIHDSSRGNNNTGSNGNVRSNGNTGNHNTGSRGTTSGIDNQNNLLALLQAQQLLLAQCGLSNSLGHVRLYNSQPQQSILGPRPIPPGFGLSSGQQPMQYHSTTPQLTPQQAFLAQSVHGSGMHSDVALLSKPSIWNEARRIANEEGFRAFWKGNLVTIAHRLPYTAVNFYAYEQYKKLLKSIPSIGDNSGTAATDACVHFVGGGMSGITAATATYPLDLIRTRLAAQRSTMYYNGIGHALRTICRDEGFFGLYKGLGATLLGVGPSIAISFSVYETLRSHWKAYRPDDSTVLVSLTCGSLSGIASSTATFPLDLVRRRKQLEGVGGQARVYNSGLLGTLGHIMRKEGLRGLYRGILPEYYKVVPGVGIVFMTYETLKKFLSDNSN
ncbi:substrate carrier protein [Artemisia annua]|uniref:Substrate carrier protein n=1 Tax=Artemisia annua TaxID=35608 RepID=A0A2U1MDK4_ARTAN|nr:substrate carrier protein [Artemisia annua]